MLKKFIKWLKEGVEESVDTTGLEIYISPTCHGKGILVEVETKKEVYDLAPEYDKLDRERATICALGVDPIIKYNYFGDKYKYIGEKVIWLK